MVYFVVGVLGFVCFGWCGFVWIVFCWFVGGGGVFQNSFRIVLFVFRGLIYCTK